MIYEQKFLTCASHVNSNMDVKNITLLHWMQDIGSFHSDSAGCGFINMAETKLSWVVIQYKVKLYRRFQYGETITIKTWCSGTKRLYTFRQFEFYDEKGELVAAASSKWVLMNLETGIADVTDELLDSYGIEEKTVFEEGNNMKRVQDVKEYSSCVDFNVPCTFIDVNGHMNNAYYLDIAYQALPLDVYFNDTAFNEFEIMYRKECRLNDALKCNYVFDGKDHVVSIRSAEDDQQHVVVRLR